MAMVGTTPERDFPVLYEEALQELDEQYDEVKALDTKLSFIVAAASVLAAGARAFQVIPLVQSRVTGTSKVAHLARVLGLAAYLPILVLSALAFRIRNVDMAPSPTEAAEALDDAPETAVRDLTRSIANSLKQNEDTIKTKAAWTRATIWALVAEGVLLVLAMLPRHPSVIHR